MQHTSRKEVTEVTKDAGLPPEEAKRRITEDERRDQRNSPPHVEAMERCERERQQAEENTSTQHRNQEGREFNEALEQHYRDRREFYRLSRGVPEAIFRAELWPEMSYEGSRLSVQTTLKTL